MKPFVSEDGSLMVLKGRKGFDFAVKTGITYTPTEKPKKPATQPLDEQVGNYTTFDTKKVASWGTNNNFPQKAIEEVQPSTIIGPVLNFLADMLVGRGIRYYEEGEPDPTTGKPQRVYKRIPEIDTFLRRSNIKRYLQEASRDLIWWYNVFAEIGLSVDGTKVVRLVAQDATFCRYQVMSDNKVIENCFISAKWPTPKQKEVEVVQVIDPYEIDRVERLRKKTPGNYIYPVSMSSPGDVYYQKAPWDAVRSGLWLKYSLQIPKMKQAIIENSMNIKYHIEIPELYWEKVFDGFSSMKPSKKQALITPVIQSFIENFSGDENSGKAFTTPFYVDKATGNEVGRWKVNVLKNDFGDKLFVEDSIEASSHILMALGVDRALVSSPGKGMGSGSGSDKRMAYNITDEMLWTKREAILEPLYFIAEYNGWPDNIKFEFMSIELMTLDSGGTKVNITNPDATN